MVKIDAVIQKYLAELKQDKELPALPPRGKRRGRGPNEMPFNVRAALYYLCGVDLTAIEGIGEMTALTLVSELGLDMSRWPTVKQFCSWLGLCPQPKKTGGKVRSSRTRPGSNRAAQALKVAASSLERSRSALGRSTAG